MQKASCKNSITPFEILAHKRVTRLEIEDVVRKVNDDQSLFPILYQKTESKEELISWHAWWACEHLARINIALFLSLKEEIISRLLGSKHEGKQRLMINILLYLPIKKPISVPLLNFCMDSMLSLQKPAAIQASSMKLAHKLCLLEPDLLSEFNILLENTEMEYYTPAIRSTIRQIQHNTSDTHKRRTKLKF